MGRLRYRGLKLAALLALHTPTGNIFLTAQRMAAQKPIRVDAGKLQGVPNFRDIGGYRTKDGHIIRYNVLYRSAVLSGMTLADNETLAPLKIRYEIDLRTPAQRSQLPTNWGPNPPEVIDIPFLVSNVPPLQAPDDLDPNKVKANALRGYASYATLNAPTIGQALHVLAQGDEPALLHCNGGRDRTGVTVAVLMTLLGASHRDVYHEYSLSNAHTPEAQRRPLAATSEHSHPPTRTDSKSQKTETPDVSLLDAFFHAIDTNYGSFQTYVREGLKLSDKDIRDLRRRLLTD